MLQTACCNLSFLHLVWILSGFCHKHAANDNRMSSKKLYASRAYSIALSLCCCCVSSLNTPISCMFIDDFVCRAIPASTGDCWCCALVSHHTCQTTLLCEKCLFHAKMVVWVFRFQLFSPMWRDTHNKRYNYSTA